MSERPAGSGANTGSVRLAEFRRPRPLTVQARVTIAAVATSVLLTGTLALRAATDADRSQARAIAAELDRPLAPRGGPQDRFDGLGSLGSDRPGALPWQTLEGAWSVTGGVASPQGPGRSVAIVETPTPSVVIDTLVVKAAAGAGIVVAEGPGDRLELVVDDRRSGWQVVRTSGGSRSILQFLPGPTADVVVQVIRQGSELRVSLDRDVREVVLVSPAPAGTGVGLVGRGRTEFARFAYLPLDPS